MMPLLWTQRFKFLPIIQETAPKDKEAAVGDDSATITTKVRLSYNRTLLNKYTKPFSPLKDAMALPKNPRKARAQVSTKEENDDGTLLLDSAVNPSFMKTPLKSANI